MAEVLIEPAGEGDLDAVQRIEEGSFPSPWRREFFETEIGADGRLNLVARIDAVVVGYLFAMWIFDELHVNKIAVEEGCRRQGVADALMDECFAFARDHDVRTITLEVRLSNTGAQRFYEHLHFKATYMRPRYYPDGEAAVVMTRNV
ncbi:MAG: ribosomal protein S18-alanine N-acetyltransferase [Thermoanaerobaculia bacterium]